MLIEQKKDEQIMTDRNVTFAELGLSEAMLKALEAKGYGYPTTIQT